MADGIVPYNGSQRTHGHQCVRSDSPAQSGMDDIAKYGIAPDEDNGKTDRLRHTFSVNVEESQPLAEHDDEEQERGPS